jgi:hypothetical protein
MFGSLSERLAALPLDHDGDDIARAHWWCRVADASEYVVDGLFPKAAPVPTVDLDALRARLGA